MTHVLNDNVLSLQKIEENLSEEDLCIIMYDCPMYFSGILEHDHFFGKIIELKREGFGTLENNYLPFDQTDLIGTHLLVCQKSKDRFLPLICTKAITESRCIQYSLPFMGFEGIKKCNSNKHIYSLEKFIKESRLKGEVAYTSSVTIHPNISNRKSRDLLLELFLPLVSQYHNEFNVPSSFCLGRDKTRANKKIEKLVMRL